MKAHNWMKSIDQDVVSLKLFANIHMSGDIYIQKLEEKSFVVLKHGILATLFINVQITRSFDS